MSHTENPLAKPFGHPQVAASMIRTLLPLLIVCTPTLAIADDYESSDDTWEVPSDVIVDNAVVTAHEYIEDGIDYAKVRPLPDGTADCNSYVSDVLNRSGIDVSPTATWQLATSPEYRAIDEWDAVPGDVIQQPGHMGVYSGTNEWGQPLGWQMGNHGPNELPWGPGGAFEGGNSLQYYRPLQTSDFEQQIADQAQSMWGVNSTGELQTEDTPHWGDVGAAAAELDLPVYVPTPASSPARSSRSPARSTRSTRSNCTGRVCASVAY